MSLHIHIQTMKPYECFSNTKPLDYRIITRPVNTVMWLETPKHGFVIMLTMWFFQSCSCCVRLQWKIVFWSWFVESFFYNNPMCLCTHYHPHNITVHIITALVRSCSSKTSAKASILGFILRKIVKTTIQRIKSAFEPTEWVFWYTYAQMYLHVHVCLVAAAWVLLSVSVCLSGPLHFPWPMKPQSFGMWFWSECGGSVCCGPCCVVRLKLATSPIQQRENMFP